MFPLASDHVARRAARVARLLLAVGLVVGGLHALGRPQPAGAAVQHVAGYRATVLGWTSWYGSYGLGAEGTAWCIDHGIRAPDPALRYVPTDLSGVPVTTRTALAWAFGRYGSAPDRVTAAALMLVGHDLMGARYPYGPLDLDVLTERSIAGFGSDGPAVLARARAIRADAVARAGLSGPWYLSIIAPPPAAGARGTATVRVTAGGRGVGAITVTVLAEGASLAGPASVTTGADGTAQLAFTATAGRRFRLTATARVPDLQLQAFAPTTARAQRVVRAATLDLHAVAAATPPTTTTSTSTTSTSTTSTSTTSTSTTSTAPSTTTTSSTSTTSTTTAPPASTSTTSTTAPPPAPPPTSPPAAPAPPTALPRTGGHLGPMASTGSGLVLLGTSLRRPRRGPSVK